MMRNRAQRIREAQGLGGFGQPLYNVVIELRPTPRMRFKVAAWRVVHLIRLRRLWSQCGAMLQLVGRRSYVRDLLQLLRICPRRGNRQWTIRQCWVYLGPIVRRYAPVFKHLKSSHGQLQHRSRPRERHFRQIVIRQIDANGWWNWTDVAIRSRSLLGQNLDDPTGRGSHNN